MKKILFLILLCCLSITTYGQYVTVETGLNTNKEVMIGSITSFNVKLNSSTAVSSESYMEITNKNGCFTNATGTADNGYTYRGTRIFNEIVYIKWKTASTGKVTMKISQTSAPIKTLLDTSWDVTVKPITDVSIVGPTEIMAGEEITYSLSKSLGSAAINWVVSDSRYAQIIGSATSSTVKVKALQAIGTLTIKASMTGIGQSFSKTIKIYPPIEIQTPGEIFCTNSKVTCNLQVPAYLPSPTIVWTGVDKFVLSSGQSSNTATFTTSGNGYGTIRAVITSLGRSITIENTKIWVGIPKISLSQAMDESSLNSSFLDISRLVTFSQYTTLTIDGYGVDLSGSVSNVEWETSSGSSPFVTGNGIITYPTNNGQGSLGRVATFKLNPGSLYNFMFKIRAKNSCGWSDWKYISWSGTVIPGGYTRSSNHTETSIFESSKDIKSVKIYNLSGVLVYSDNAVNGSFDIKSTVLTDGVYIIEKFDGENRTSEKVMLKR